MWRRTERASLEKKPSTRLSQEPCLGVKVNSEPVGALFGKPTPRLSGDVRGMIVEDQVDRRVGRVCGVEQLEEVDELAAAMTILDQGVNFAGQQVDAGHQCHGAVALVFVVACEGRMHAGLRRQIGRCRGERLDTGLLVVGDDRDRLAWLLLAESVLLQKLHLAIDAQHLGHLFRKLGVALLQVVAHLVRLHLFLIEDLAHRTLRQCGEGGVPLRRPMLASVAGQKPRRPQSRMFRSA